MCAQLQEGSDPLKAWADFVRKQSSGSCVYCSYSSYVAFFASSAHSDGKFSQPGLER